MSGRATSISGETGANTAVEMNGGRKSVAISIAVLLVIAAATVVVFLFRDDIARYASFGYPAIFSACFLLNCGVFGLSPSGLVAVEMSYVFDPALTAVVAGLGVGLGESVSYYAGMKTDVLFEPGFLRRFAGFGPIKTGAAAFFASFLSGNLSDALGVACGRLGSRFASYMVGATAAKVAKMLLLVWAAHVAAGYLGFLGLGE